MRILIALTYYRPHYSGLTIYAEREARALAARGHQVTILTSRFDPRLAEREMRDGVEVIRPRVWFHVSKGVIMPGMWLEAWRQLIQTDAVQLHVPQLDAVVIALLGKLLRKPVVLTYHCDLVLPKGSIHKLASYVSTVVNFFAAWMADLIVANTRDYAENSPILRRFLHKVVPIYPPVEIEPITPAELQTFRVAHAIQSDQRIIGMAARLATEKGVEVLVQALPQVLEHFPTARVLFVGPYQDVVGEESYVERLMPTIHALQHHWSFLGVVSPSEMAAFFHASEVIVLPSLNSTESFGIVQVEALTCGTPVIASDLPGVREPVLKTGSGRIVPAGDATQLAQALIAVLENPGMYRGHPEELVRISSPAIVAEKYEHYFQLAQEKIRLKETRF